MITVNRLKGSDNYQSWANSVKLWFTGNGVEDHVTSMKSSIVEDKRPQWQNMTFYSVTFSNNPYSPKYSTTLGIIRPVNLFGPKQSICILMIFNASTMSSHPLIVWSSLV